MAQTEQPPKRLSSRIKFIYGLGDWGTSAATTVRNTFWFIFLTNVVGLNPALAGTTFLVGKLWDGINDPLIGMLSDRIQTRWGRRRPFLLFGSVPFGLSFLLLFVVPPFESEIALAVYYSIAFLLFDTMYTIVNVPYAALTPELSDDYDERSNITGWRIGVSIFAALVTAATFTLLAEDVIGARLGGGTEAIRTGYLIVAAIWSVTLIVPYLILFKTITEPEREPDTDPFRPIQTFKEVFQNRPFRLGALIYLLSFATVDVILIVFIRFLIDYVRVEPGFDNLLLATVMGVAFLSMPAVVWLMRRYGKRNTYIGSMMMMAVVLIIMAQVPPGGQNLMFIASIFAGLGYGAANAIPWAIVADVVEEDELRTGKRREGIYAGYLVFLRKLASAVAVFIVGQVLSASGYISSTGGGFYIEQPEAALNAMRFFVSTFPAVMLLLAVLVAWRYPLDRERFNEIKEQLAERRMAER
ncbi:MAG: MFS transporter [Chloroflexi bacterium]|nr:MFS transporter [Chloroflexota bacterium]